MGIRLVTPAKVLNHAIEKFAQLTGEVWKGFNRNGLLYGPSGDDSPPCKDDQIILVKIDGTGKYVAIGVLDVSQGAKPGERIIYARDADGKLVSKIAMLNDGSIAVEAEGDISVDGKKNITTEAAEKNTVKGKDIEVNGNTKITGGTLECNGTASPTGTGCWCAKPFCTWDGSPHTGNRAVGT